MVAVAGVGTGVGAGVVVGAGVGAGVVVGAGVGAGVVVGAAVVVVGLNNLMDNALPFHLVTVHGVLKKLHHPVL